jgi:hypothetical protein
MVGFAATISPILPCTLANLSSSAAIEAAFATLAFSLGPSALIWS